MGRYEILLNTPPEAPEKTQPEIFGLDTKIIGSQAFKYELFHPDEKERLIGLLYNDPKTMFISRHVHYNKKWGYFLCKTVGNNKQICCERYTRGIRVGCAVISYGSPNRFYRFLFGKKLFTMIQTLHYRSDLTAHDMYLKKAGPFEYNIYVSAPSMWKTFEAVYVERLSRIIEEIHSELPRSLGKNLSIEQITHDDNSKYGSGIDKQIF